ncbi:hypothetical protein JWG39_13435 [Desulforhopalus vacuolatus]|nr:hypothetical protein [Desulforhopalus vacuolatus]MBM9520817.1 hypothetical protein [Desulforhopalus vacuolatus]MBM9520818.1 hypothetical protein [Desulforhopalus vacuolatus]MBM9520819.1 hypothetical protein [Desulforhopalus vacuolatus]MBM9520820.1 hypothetical protein [Desulforhopalus vacuolatus]
MKTTALALIAMIFTISMVSVSFATDTHNDSSDNFIGYRWNGNQNK